MLFDKFKGRYIRVLDWAFFSSQVEASDVKKSYVISDDYKLIGTTISGDLLAIKGKYLVQIDHENPVPEEDLQLSDDLELVKIILNETKLIPEFEGCDDIKKLKSIKKQIKKVWKKAPEVIKDDFEEAIMEIEDEIDFLK
ncbi:MAG: hypothetical protein AAGI38_10630 [Bacteroidota bacterium]